MLHALAVGLGDEHVDRCADSGGYVSGVVVAGTYHQHPLELPGPGNQRGEGVGGGAARADVATGGDQAAAASRVEDEAVADGELPAGGSGVRLGHPVHHRVAQQ